MAGSGGMGSMQQQAQQMMQNPQAMQEMMNSPMMQVWNYIEPINLNYFSGYHGKSRSHARHHPEQSANAPANGVKSRNRPYPQQPRTHETSDGNDAQSKHDARNDEEPRSRSVEPRVLTRRIQCPAKILQ